MKLDATDLRYVTQEEFRVLTAVEMGSKNHEVVPTSLISQIASLRSGGVNKIVGSLAKRNLISRVQNAKYDGYRLTYGGYDYLAIRALSKRDSMYSVGNQIGVGKESDVYVVADIEGNSMALKIHRLGRVSFRAIKEKRDYMGKRKSASWMYMSRLAAQKEWAFMQVLHEHGFPVPKPVDCARHCILMGLIDAYPLRQISDVASPGKLYSQLMDLIVRFAHAGLIHGDFNEFNILIKRDSGEPVVIDFPQMVSTSHENAEWYFNRDVECIRTFFRRRFHYESVLYPRFRSTMSEGEESGEGFKLDVVVSASGFSKKEQQTLSEYMKSVGEEPQIIGSDEEMEEESDEDEDDEDGDAEDDVPPGRRSEASSEVKGEDDIDDGESDRHSTSTRRSRAPSPTDSLIAHTASMRLSQSPPSGDALAQEGRRTESTHTGDVKTRIASDLTKQSASQARYHSKRGARKIGRPKGSKAKQDTRVKLDKSGFWD